MANTKGHRFRGDERHENHRFNDCPPRQDKFFTGRDESPSTAKPIGHRNVHPGSGHVLKEIQAADGYGKPDFDDLDSSHIHPSTTKGK